jgi:hypothetical protein
MRTFFHRAICVSLLAVAVVLPSCHKQSSPTQSPTRPSTPTSERVVFDTTTMHYVQCDENVADTVLKVKVIIRNVANQEFTFPLRKERLYDDNGYLRLASGPQAFMVSADGVKNGHGIGYDGSAGLFETTDHDVTIGVNFSWTAADNTQGKFDRNITIPIGQNFEQQLSDVASVKASFQSGIRR